MAKLIGSVTLILSALYYSYLLLQNAKKKLDGLDALCTMIAYIQNNIETLMRPIGEIVHSFSDYPPTLEPFMACAREMGLKEASIRCASSLSFLGSKAYDVLCTFSHSIGCGYREDEIRLCTYCHKALTEIASNERAEMQKKKKLYKTLPVMSALSVVLLFL